MSTENQQTEAKTPSVPALSVAHCSAGLVMRLRSIADDECEDDEWMADVLRQSANKIERMERGLRLIKSGGGSPEERRAFCREASIDAADADGMARAALASPNTEARQPGT